MSNGYTIGLDIGTNSVGYAVVKDDYTLVTKKMKVLGNTDKKVIKKNFWGVRLFEEGLTAEARRLSRTTRRRYTRRRKRLEELQKIFHGEMEKVDRNFFIRLEDSFLVKEEKRREQYPIFGTLEEEEPYHSEFPTIYHLRKQLADSTERADIRLVYLACAHILKYRGHFLIEGDLDPANSSVKELFKIFLQEYNRVFTVQEDGSLINYLDNSIEIDQITKEKVSRTKKVENILALFPNEKRNGTLAQFFKLIIGLKGNFQTVFELDEKIQLEIPKDSYEEDLSTLLEAIGDEYTELFIATKNLYDAIVLSNILVVDNTSTRAKLSASMIQRYDEHKNDLQKLKKFIKIYLPETYSAMFKDTTQKGYAGYIDGSVSQDDFYQYVKKLIEGIDGSDYFLKKIEQENFLRKQRTFDNGAIPHQIHLAELKAILENQSHFYPALKDNCMKIIEMFKFRIPYFIGPLAKGNSQFSWLVRKTDEKIQPWNIREIVDFESSATKFIERMTNNDTYLPDEKVLPKQSLIYQKFLIFNELTKVSYTDDRGKVLKFSSEEKIDIFNKLFKVERQVTQKKLEKFLQNEYHIEAPTVHGIENKFNSNYATYHDFSKISGIKEILDQGENDEMFEEIVKILTLFEDRKMIENQISEFDTILTKKMIKELARKKYTGWGRLSYKLINGIRDQETNKTILDFLIEDDAQNKNINRNFMQLINEDTLSFKAIIKEAQVIGDDDPIEEIVYQLTGSPAIKKGILQSIRIVDEIVSIMGSVPKNITIEMARENQTTARGKQNAKPRLKSLEDAMKELGSNLLTRNPVDNKKLQIDRVYLYYLQNGKDMYTGEDLDLENLSSYDIDHIIPQSFIKDDSLDNRVLVSARSNRDKSNDVPKMAIVNKMLPLWNELKKSNLISQRKYDHLTKALRGGLTDEDKAIFIKRQLVETRQITKHVAQILDKRYNTKINHEGKKIREVDVITLKSSLVSQFRKQFDIYKVREINDYHHAHDAYLNTIVANVLIKRYPQLKPEFVYGDYLKYNSFAANKATAKKNTYTNSMLFFASDEPVINKESGEVIWNKKTDISTIKKVLQSKQMNIVKKVERQKGGFSKETIKPKGDSNKLIPRKTGWNPSKYGGFDSPIISYSVAFTYEKGKAKKRAQQILGITIMQRQAFETNTTLFLEKLGYLNPQIVLILPKYSLYVLPDGRRRLISGGKEAQKANQLVLPDHLVALLYHSLRYEKLKYPRSYNYVNTHKEQFLEIVNQVINFSQKYILAEKNQKNILEIYEKNKNRDVKKIAESCVNLLGLTSQGAPSDFKFFDQTMPRYRYTTITEAWKGTVIHQSITGMYETRITLEG